MLGAEWQAGWGRAEKWEWEGLQLEGTGPAMEMTTDEEGHQAKVYFPWSLGEEANMKPIRTYVVRTRRLEPS